MIRHMVMLKIRDDVDRREIDSTFAALASLPERFDGIEAFQGGPFINRKTKPLRNPGFTHGFTIDLRDQAAREAFSLNPEIEAIAAKVYQGMLDGPPEKAVVAFDFEIMNV